MLQFPGAMELMAQDVDELVDKVTNLQNLPFPKASDQEILLFDEILARNAGAHCPKNSSTKEIIIPTVKLEGLYAKNNNNNLKVVQASIARSLPVCIVNKSELMEKLHSHK